MYRDLRRYRISFSLYMDQESVQIFKSQAKAGAKELQKVFEADPASQKKAEIYAMSLAYLAAVQSARELSSVIRKMDSLAAQFPESVLIRECLCEVLLCMISVQADRSKKTTWSRIEALEKQNPESEDITLCADEAQRIFEKATSPEALPLVVYHTQERMQRIPSCSLLKGSIVETMFQCKYKDYIYSSSNSNGDVIRFLSSTGMGSLATDYFISGLTCLLTEGSFIDLERIISVAEDLYQNHPDYPQVRTAYAFALSYKAQSPSALDPEKSFHKLQALVQSHSEDEEIASAYAHALSGRFLNQLDPDWKESCTRLENLYNQFNENRQIAESLASVLAGKISEYTYEEASSCYKLLIPLLDQYPDFELMAEVYTSFFAWTMHLLRGDERRQAVDTMRKAAERFPACPAIREIYRLQKQSARRPKSKSSPVSEDTVSPDILKNRNEMNREITRFEKVVKEQPENENAIASLCVCYAIEALAYDSDDFTAKRRLIEKYQQKYPANARIAKSLLGFILGSSAEDLKDLDSTHALVIRLDQDFQNDSEIHLVCCGLLRSLADITDSRSRKKERLEQSIRISSSRKDSPYFALNLAQSLLDLVMQGLIQDRTPVLAELDSLRKQHPDYFEILNAWGTVLAEEIVARILDSSNKNTASVLLEEAFEEGYVPLSCLGIKVGESMDSLTVRDMSKIYDTVVAAGRKFRGNEEAATAVSMIYVYLMMKSSEKLQMKIFRQLSQIFRSFPKNQLIVSSYLTALAFQIRRQPAREAQNSFQKIVTTMNQFGDEDQILFLPAFTSALPSLQAKLTGQSSLDLLRQAEKLMSLAKDPAQYKQRVAEIVEKRFFARFKNEKFSLFSMLLQ